MSQFVALTLNALVYAPAGYINSRIARWRNIPSGAPSNGANEVTLDIRQGQNGAVGTTKTQWKIRLPTLVEDASACACPGDIRSEVVIDLVVTAGQLSTVADRTAARLALTSLVATAAFIDSVDNQNPVWG